MLPLLLPSLSTSSAARGPLFQIRHQQKRLHVLGRLAAAAAVDNRATAAAAAAAAAAIGAAAATTAATAATAAAAAARDPRCRYHPGTGAVAQRLSAADTSEWCDHWTSPSAPAAAAAAAAAAAGELHACPVAASVFTIQDEEDEEEQESDLFTQGALRLGALAAGVCASAENTSPTDAAAAATAAAAGGEDAAAQAAATRVAAAPHKQHEAAAAAAAATAADETSTSASAAEGLAAHETRGKPQASQRGQHAVAAAAAAAAAAGAAAAANTRGLHFSSSSISSSSSSSKKRENFPTPYKPEVDGPPVIGIYVLRELALGRRQVIFAHQQADAHGLSVHPIETSRCAADVGQIVVYFFPSSSVCSSNSSKSSNSSNSSSSNKNSSKSSSKISSSSSSTRRVSVWRGQQQANSSSSSSSSSNGTVACSSVAEARLLQWVECLALPELSPLGPPHAPLGSEPPAAAAAAAAAERRHLPSASHVFFTIPTEANKAYLFGVSCYCTRDEQEWDSATMDEAWVSCAVCLVARVPFWGLLLFRLLPVGAAFMELIKGAPQEGMGARGAAGGGGAPMGAPHTQVLVQLYEQLNTVNFHLMRYTEITFNLEARLPPFILSLNPPDACRASTAVLSFLSLFPAGLACGFTCDGFGEHQYRWTHYGMPFRVFESRAALFPLLPLELVDDLLLQKRSFLVASTNPTLATHPVVHPDLLVDVDNGGLKVQSPSLEVLLRLSPYELKLAARMSTETASAAGARDTPGATSSSSSSSSISKHATDLLQQTISSLANHAAAHGLPFLKAKDDTPAVSVKGGDPLDWLQGSVDTPGGCAIVSSDHQQHKRREAASPRDSSSRSSSSRVYRGRDSRSSSSSSSSSSSTAGSRHLEGSGSQRATEGRRAHSIDCPETLDAASFAQRGRRGSFQEGEAAAGLQRAGSSWEQQKQQQQQQQGSEGSGSTPSGGGSWLGGKLRWSWERQAAAASPASSSSKKQQQQLTAEGRQHTGELSSVGPSPSVGARSMGCIDSSAAAAANGGTSSRNSSDTSIPVSLVDPNWEVHADLLRAAFAQHLEELCRRAAIAAGPARSRQQLLQQLSRLPAAAEGAEGLDAFGAEWVKAWTTTHNFQAWLSEHRLPCGEAAAAKHEGQQPPPASGFARYFYSNGDTYEGQFSASLRHGDGVYSSADGMKYDGSWVADERHGHGVLAHEAVGYFNSNSSRKIVCGVCIHAALAALAAAAAAAIAAAEWSCGRYVQRDGLEYEGEFVRGRFEGLGKLTVSRGQSKDRLRSNKRGVVIRGGFKEGKVTGVVTAVYADGRTYTGHLSPETLLPDGCGSMLYEDSCCYDGEWRNGLRHGAGVLSIPVSVLRTEETQQSNEQQQQQQQQQSDPINTTTTSSSSSSSSSCLIVDGQWADDLPCGDAEWDITFPSGDKYLGHLSFSDAYNTSSSSNSSSSSSSGSSSSRRIVPHGWGLSKRRDTGEVYEGEWKDGMRHGHGESISGTGSRYCGEWRRGLPHGAGRLVDATSGCTLEGLFQFGNFVGEASPGCETEEREDSLSAAAAEPPPLQFEAFTNYPLGNCSLFQPQETHAAVTRSSSSRSFHAAMG
ncbi:hypothetical protein Emed_004317 [Eimeria media]